MIKCDGDLGTNNEINFVVDQTIRKKNKIKRIDEKKKSQTYV